MWSAKVKVHDENGVYATGTLQYGVSVHGQMLTSSVDDSHIHFTVISSVQGDELAKKQFIQYVRKNAQFDNLRIQGNVFVCRLKEKTTSNRFKLIKLFYDPSLIQIKPFVVYKNGWEELEIACFDRTKLENIIQEAQKTVDIELLSIKKTNLETIGFMTAFPNLTDKQESAIHLARTHGYYTYPREIDVKDLAKIQGVTFSTFQEHLRKAENKLIPYLANKIQ